MCNVPVRMLQVRSCVRMLQVRSCVRMLQVCSCVRMLQVCSCVRMLQVRSCVRMLGTCTHMNCCDKGLEGWPGVYEKGRRRQMRRGVLACVQYNRSGKITECQSWGKKRASDLQPHIPLLCVRVRACVCGAVGPQCLGSKCVSTYYIRL